MENEGKPAKMRKRRPFNPGLAFKLSLYLLTSMAIIFAVVVEYSYDTSKRMVLKNVEESTRNLTQSTVNRMETLLGGVQNVTLYLAHSLERQKPSRQDLLGHIRDVLATDGNIFGCSVAYEPFAFHHALERFSPYTYREQKVLKTVYPEQKVAYHELEWYRLPRELNGPYWSEPYLDHFGGWIQMATYSAPFYRMIHGKKTFQGVVIADMSLTWLDSFFSKITIYRSGYAFLMSRRGVIMTHPNKAWIMKESIFTIADKAGDPDLKKIGRSMIEGKSGFVALDSHFVGKRSRLYYAPLPSSGWSIGVVIPDDELFADIGTLRHDVSLIGLAGFLLLLTVIVAISGRITIPLRRLAFHTREIAQGNFDVALPPMTARDEVGELTASFEQMRRALKQYMIDLRETTASKERIDSELKIAREIQMSFLPKHFPAFPDRKEFDIYADLEPAREVGGDFYDFFLMDKDHLFIAIGDVSGKGVPAALFMAAAKIVMKEHAAWKTDPADILDGANRDLCKDNSSLMFVTVFCGILDLRTGELRYSNAGHNPPVIIRHDGVGMNVDWLPVPHGLFLAVMEDARYMTSRVLLQPQDRLLLFTDGVTEAMDAQQQPYSDERLLQRLNLQGNMSPQEMIPDVLRSIKAFTGETVQSDDITLLAVQFKGGDAS